MQIVFDLLSRSPRPLLIVGGHALAAHAVLRQTIDIDLLIAADDQQVLDSLLRSEGWQLVARSENFARYQSNQPDLPDIDVLLVDRDTFDKLEQESVALRRGGHDFRVPGLKQLIALKLHAIRNEPRRIARDLADIAELLRLNPGKIGAEELDDLCQQFGPPAIRDKLSGFE
jgi:hypothetical protein